MLRTRLLAVLMLIASFGITVPIAVVQAPAQAAVTTPYDGWVTRTDGVSGHVLSQSNPKVPAPVWDMVEINGTMYVAGQFLKVVRATSGWAEVDQPFLAAFDVQTGAWLESFRPVLDGPVWTLEKGNGMLYVGGEFTKVNGQPRAGLVGLDPRTGATSTTFTGAVSRPDSTLLATVRDIKLRQNRLYLTGNFSRAIGAGQRIQVDKAVRMDPTTGAPDSTWHPILAGRSGWAVDTSVDGTRVYLGGEFSYVNGAPGTATFAAVNATDGALVPGFRHGFGAPKVAVWPNGGIVFDLGVYKDKVYIAGAEHFWEIRSATDGSQVKLMTQLDTPTLLNPKWYGFNDTQDVHIANGVVYIGCHCYRYRGWGDFAIDAETGNIIGHPTQSIEAGDAGWAHAMDSQGCLWAGGDFRGSKKVVGLPETGATYWVGQFARLCPPGGPVDGAQALLASPATWQVNTSGTWPDGWTTTGFTPTGWQSVTAPMSTGGVSQVSSVEIWNRTDCCSTRLSNFYVMTSPVPFGSKTLDQLKADPKVTKTKITATPSPSVTVPVNADTRYVRVQLDGPGILSLAEVKAINAKGINLTRSKFVEQSSTGWGGLAARAVDGRTTGVWNQASVSSTTNETNPWWQIDLSGTTGWLDDTAKPINAIARTTFTVTDPTKFTAAALDLSADDGATVWLNGKPVLARNVRVGAIDAKTPATTEVSAPVSTTANRYYIAANNLVAGTNTVAVSFHRSTTTSPELGFGLKILGWTGAGPAITPAPALTVAGVTAPVVATKYDATGVYTAGEAPADWTKPTFDAASWTAIKGVLGLASTQVTTQALPAGKIAYYARYTINVPAGDAGTAATLSMLRDDGIVVYLNGAEVGRDNMPAGAITPTTLASSYIFGAAEVTPVSMPIPAGRLVAGTNTIAIEVHQAHPDSKDLLLGLTVEKKS